MDKKTEKIFVGIFLAAVIFVFLPLLFVVVHLPARGGAAGATVIFEAQKSAIEAEIADTFAERARGLMGRASLPAEAGMLFVFNGEERRAFWMKNVKIPLDLFFVSGAGEIVDIKENFFPCQDDPCPAYESSAPAKYVLETNAGKAAAEEIKRGGKIKIIWR